MAAVPLPCCPTLELFGDLMQAAAPKETMSCRIQTVIFIYHISFICLALLRTYKRPYENNPCVLQDIVPFGATVQKEAQEAQEAEEEEFEEKLF